MIKKLMYLLLMLGAFAPSFLTAQNNRIAIQTGLFHITFDKTPLFNSMKTTTKILLRNPYSYFGGHFNESLGFHYERKLINNTSLSLEYMSHNVTYEYIFKGLSTKDKGPFLVSKMTKKININYNRKVRLSNKIEFVYGGGVNYIWGEEMVYLFSNATNWGGYEPHFYSIYRNDVGFNIRTGIEYSPIKRITLYTNFDFLGIAFLNAKGLNGDDSYRFFKDKYNVDHLPSRWDISWQFGIGFNFN